MNEAALVQSYRQVRQRLMNGSKPVDIQPVERNDHPARDRMALLTSRAKDIPQPFVPIKFLISKIDDATIPKWRRIAMEICNKHQISMNDLMASRRPLPLVLARHEAWYRCYLETTMSLPKIGYVFGRKDHSSVLSGIRRHCERNNIQPPDKSPTRKGTAQFKREKLPTIPRPDLERWKTLGSDIAMSSN